jgi:sialate O-acetylesterase
MMKALTRYTSLTLALLFALPLLAPREALPQEAEFAQIFGDHMVVQRDRAIRVWGTATPGQRLIVRLQDHQRETASDPDGAWSVELPALPAGGPHRLRLEAADGVALTVEDVLVGDVWLCSGQSNMEYPMANLNEPWREAANPPGAFRLLTVTHDHATSPLAEFGHEVAWQVADPDSVMPFSAACYLFARELRNTLDVPFGLIDASWGGSAIESWISSNGLAGLGGYDERLDLVRAYGEDPVHATAEFAAVWENWWRQAGSIPGPWLNETDDSEWAMAPEALGSYRDWDEVETADHLGMVWYRNRFDLTPEQAQGEAVLELGAIDELDISWVNGQAVGTQFGWGTPRRYRLAPGVLKAGSNTVTVNVYNSWGAGGLTGPPESIRLVLADGSIVGLGNGWRYRVVPTERGTPPMAPWESITGLTGLYNAMIAPMRGFGFAGALWYQGESNAGRAHSYEGLLGAMIADWRSELGASIPFLVVQLPNFGALPDEPHESGWALLRDAQQRVAAADPLTGLVVTLDSADRTDLHPPNKRIVAARAVAAARGLLTGSGERVDGILPSGAYREGNRVMVEFDPKGQPLRVVGAAAPAAFELCGPDTGCRYANAVLDDGRIRVDASSVPNATEVRYAWADAPLVNLFGAEDLPVGSFRLKIGNRSD